MSHRTRGYHCIYSLGPCQEVQNNLILSCLLTLFFFFLFTMESVKTHDSNSRILFRARLLLLISILQLHLARQNKSKSVIRAYNNISITMALPEHLESRF